MYYLMRRLIIVPCVVMIVFFMGACIQSNPSHTPTATTRSLLTPYLTVTPSKTPLIEIMVLKIPTFKATTTPTPVTYTVAKGDTMLGIALRFGITLEELMAANPQVNPRIISIGTVLVIPLGENSPALLSTPTPIPIIVEEPDCYSTASGGAWCFLLVKNTQIEPLENLAARILLISSQSEVVAEGFALPPLNLVPPEKAIPLIYYFAPPVPENYTPLAELMSALPVTGGEERYLPARFKIESEAIDPNGFQATVQGEVSLPKKSRLANQTWIAIVAYGTNGEVVGVRKWEANSTLEAGEDLPFEITVYSLGPPIERVEVLVEARP